MGCGSSSNQVSENDDSAESSDQVKPITSIGWDEIQRLSKDGKTIIVVSNKVYNATSFMSRHPGGKYTISSNAGRDCTVEFNRMHSDYARNLFQPLFIGELDCILSDVSHEPPS
mmetsp:Transcript_40871/g.109370  ORF Transcript_40871/g.109370 Transcript_40871/m.109370 type:complete len:114 (-) Transcript_40871:61-402(-)